MMKTAALLAVGLLVLYGVYQWGLVSGGSWGFVAWAETTFGADEWTLGLVGAGALGVGLLIVVKYI